MWFEHQDLEQEHNMRTCQHICACVCVCVPCGSSGQQMWSVWRGLWLLFRTVSVSPGHNHTALLCWRTPSQSRSCPGSQTLCIRTTHLHQLQHANKHHMIINMRYISEIIHLRQKKKKRFIFDGMLKHGSLEQTLFKQEEAVHLFGLFSAAQYLHSVQVNIYTCFL